MQVKSAMEVVYLGCFQNSRTACFKEDKAEQIMKRVNKQLQFPSNNHKNFIPSIFFRSIFSLKLRILCFSMTNSIQSFLKGIAKSLRELHFTEKLTSRKIRSNDTFLFYVLGFCCGQIVFST